MIEQGFEQGFEQGWKKDCTRMEKGLSKD